MLGPKLFIDTTHNVTVGLLAEDFSWIDFETIEEKKSSQIIHAIVYEKLQKLNLVASDLSGLVYAAGPGSYTGTRLGSGIGDLFQWQSFPTYSFYHFEIPQLLGSNEGIWCCPAFKNEVFAYKWNDQIQTSQLIAEKDFDGFIAGESSTRYTGSDSPLFNEFIRTDSLLKSDSQKLISEVVAKELQRETFYFRSAENEYKIPQI
jgi:tRNA threonylcarbamoyladenosine biosynthesis protein TsaB